MQSKFDPSPIIKQYYRNHLIPRWLKRNLVTASCAESGAQMCLMLSDLQWLRTHVRVRTKESQCEDQHTPRVSANLATHLGSHRPWFEIALAWAGVQKGRYYWRIHTTNTRMQSHARFICFRHRREYMKCADTLVNHSIRKESLRCAIHY